MNRWWLHLVGYARPYWRGLAGVLLMMLAGMGLSLLSPWPLKLIVDYALTGESLPSPVAWISTLPGAGTATGLLAWLAAASVGLFLTSRLVAITGHYVKAGIGSRMEYDLGADLFDLLQRRSLRFHSQSRAGDLVRRVVADASCIRGLVMEVLLPAVIAVATLLLMFLVMWRLSPTLALLALLTALPLGLLIRYFARPMADRKYRKKELQGELMSLAERTLTAVPIVQAFSREAHEEDRFRRLSRRTVQANLRAAVSKQHFKVSTGAVTAVATAAFMAMGGVQVLQGSLAIGSLLVLLYYCAALYSPMETLAYLVDGHADAAAGARRVLELFEAEADGVRESAAPKPLRKSPATEQGHVQLKGVTFGYDPGRAVLHDVSLEARPGQVVALVGATGAGKSTLVTLIPRLFDPWQGSVVIDGTDVRQLELAGLRSQVGLVLQEPFLLPLTVAENIAYGRPGATTAEIVAAAEAARATGFVERLPKRYDTVIGERGATLSSGERQRLAIARALLRDAPILILDEPTAALDAETETELLGALERLMESRTTFLIAHRLSTIREADWVVILENGRVVEQARLDELLSGGEHYPHFHGLYTDRGAPGHLPSAMGTRPSKEMQVSEPVPIRGAG